MSNVAIRVEGLGKQYRIGRRERYRALRDTLNDALQAPFRAAASRLNGSRARNAEEEAEGYIWALKDVSFEVKQGEVVGIIGRNGAGKSTLLKVLSRITEPTEGYAAMHGRIGSLLEVGTGFHPELTGRENVYLNGSILGMKKREIERKFDEIVAFAEIEKFLDTPVKRYSSGMYVRLAFAVAAHLEPEILVVDEVLAVGDAAFQKKCLGKMGDIAREGRTVLFVSHNMIAIQNLCSRAILLESGSLVCDGGVQTCVVNYIGNGGKQESNWQRASAGHGASLLIDSVAATLDGYQPEHRLLLDVKLVSKAPHKPAFIAIDIHDATGTAIMQALPTLEGFITDEYEEHTVKLAVELPPLIPGHYLVSVWVGGHNTETLDEAQKCASFEISQSPTEKRTFPHTPDHGYIVPNATLEYLPHEAKLAIH